MRADASIGSEQVPGTSRVRRCEVCGADIPPEREMTVLVPDSSVVDPVDSSRDGQRMVTVCSAAEVPGLIAAGRAAWRDEQLWLGRLAKASSEPGAAGMDLRQVARRAFLGDEQLRLAVEWNRAQAVPMTELPGGQPLPVR
ncbi:hypothetical protein ORV05_23540 [Amycolatopsis cynarae]|uniref:Uncharacterized protein n=1 Tax=Amycolatopsis cynarae TaxID=2995223 RepID=A0ABY7AYD3_9PSEU|nr:hypothetical protein [Amycolatopsis sp. HUAS 11-8]WAL63952.1 hypothetical protein ORV05_23540 [Amycolatopsis sp. HUAS 11-8]